MEQWIQWFSDAVNEKSITDAAGLKSDVACNRGTYVNDDAYDPRKPEYIAAASQEEVEASEAKLVALQRYKLEATMQRRRASIAPQVVEHYERVLDNMSQTTRSCARSEFAQAGGSHASRACGPPRSDPIGSYASTKADDTEVDIAGEVGRQPPVNPLPRHRAPQTPGRYLGPQLPHGQSTARSELLRVGETDDPNIPVWESLSQVDTVTKSEEPDVDRSQYFLLCCSKDFEEELDSTVDSTTQEHDTMSESGRSGSWDGTDEWDSHCDSDEHNAHIVVIPASRVACPSGTLSVAGHRVYGDATGNWKANCACRHIGRRVLSHGGA